MLTLNGYHDWVLGCRLKKFEIAGQPEIHVINALDRAHIDIYLTWGFGGVNSILIRSPWLVQSRKIILRDARRYGYLEDLAFPKQ